MPELGTAGAPEPGTAGMPKAGTAGAPELGTAGTPEPGTAGTPEPHVAHAAALEPSLIGGCRGPAPVACLIYPPQNNREA